MVAGTLTKIDCELVELSTGEKVRCNVEIWSRPWLEENGEGTKISIDCPEKPHLSSHTRHSRSVPAEHVEKKHHKKLYGQGYLNKTEHLFNKFQIKYKRMYHTEAERQLRFRIFQRNLKLINDLNRFEMGKITVFHQ